jgi:phytoene dehydrogenase-like protein
LAEKFDAVVVGSGPNGLSAAVALALANLSVLVLEANNSIGGATRTAELTLPGFHHDICSAVHPLATASPFLRKLPLQEHGLEWIEPPIEAAHPLDGGDCVSLFRDPEKTAEALGADKNSYLRTVGKFAKDWEKLIPDTLGLPLRLPQHPFLLAQFGPLGLLSASTFARFLFRTQRARALFSGIAAHANAPLNQGGTSAIGLMLTIAGHARGWPIPKGGAQKIADALTGLLRARGGQIRTNFRVNSLKDIPSSRIVLWDLSPCQIAQILAERLSPSAKSRLERFRYGPGVFKIDWALSGPIPWAARDAALSATVHLGGTLAEIEQAEASPAQGQHAERPYVLLSQPTLFDSSRAPPGKHIAWGYCHVPNGSTVDMTGAVESQIERFAPGFRDLVLHRSVRNTRLMEEGNANLVGGDISGGALSMRQLFFRDGWQLDPYRLPVPAHFICSSSVPPGPGVHGMSGYNAAQSALHFLEKRDKTSLS